MAPLPGGRVPVELAVPGLPAAAARPVSRASRAATAAGALVPLVVAQGLAFALLAGSGKIPPLVIRVFRALLTL